MAQLTFGHGRHARLGDVTGAIAAYPPRCAATWPALRAVDRAPKDRPGAQTRCSSLIRRRLLPPGRRYPDPPRVSFRQLRIGVPGLGYRYAHGRCCADVWEGRMRIS